MQKKAIPELEREVWIGKYRVDFLVRCKKVVIELYGYQWHNTKEKLTQDAERERVLQQLGYHVIRFTGSEVHRNVHKCVQDVLSILQTLPDAIEPASIQRTAVLGNASANQRPSQPNVAVHKVRSKAKSLFGLKIWQLGILGGLFVLDTVFLIGAAVVLLKLVR